jgi:arginase
LQSFKYLKSLKFHKLNLSGMEIDPNKKQDIKQGTVVVLGIPFDEYSSFLKGAVQGPARIREVLDSDSGNWFTENLLGLGDEDSFIDIGDLKVFDFLEDIEPVITDILQQKGKILTLGGDHSITYPIIKAYSKFFGDLNILQFDAHPDLYHEYAGNPYSHGCQFARIMEKGLVKRLVQVGIRAMTWHQKEQADRFNVEIIEMKDFRPDMNFNFEGPVYISLDLDGLDPAFAPGVSHLEPGGLSVRDILSVIHKLENPVVGADIVELNPIRDINNMTATVAGKFLKEFSGKMLEK